MESNHRMAILGAGPIGLEAALYARYLGYEVLVLERGAVVASHVRAWGQVRLFSPFSLNSTPLGCGAIQTQDPDWEPPEPDALLTGDEHVQRYLEPLAATDLLEDHIRVDRQVLAIGRRGALKGEFVKDRRRVESPFVILSRDSTGDEHVDEADLVVDCTGVFGEHNHVGPGGIPAIGELHLGEAIQYGLPDVLGDDRGEYAGRHTLVIGGGYSAATTVVALAELATAEPATRISWVTRCEGGQPLSRIAGDRLVSRDELAVAANRLASTPDGAVAYRSGRSVVALTRESAGGPITVRLDDGETFEVDRIIANVGYRPDTTLYRELQVHECYATSGPMKLAATLMGRSKR